MIHLHPLHRLVVVALAAVSVTACDFSGIGEGSRPEKLEIIRNPQSALLDTSDEVEAFYRCFPDQLQAVVTFTNGRIDASALLNDRVRWSSSDPSVVEVSNRDVLLPDSETQAFGPGVLVPRSAGTAIVSAEFVGLTASYEVEIREVESVTINKDTVKLAPETGDLLTLTARVGDFDLDVTQLAVWSFDADEDDTEDIATIGASTGVVTAVGLGGPLTAQGQFTLCKDDPRFADLKATVDVEPLAGLDIAREFADAPNGELIVGTTERLAVTGRFADGTTLDLSGQVRVESSDNEVIAAGLAFPQFVTALKAGTSQLKAIYGGDDENDEEGDTDPPEVQSESITLNAVDGEFQSFVIAPENATITALGTQQFTATGSFSVSGQTRTQDITRGVVWSRSTLEDTATADVDISSSSLTAGRAISRRPAAGAYKITATRGVGDDAIVQSTTLCVQLPNTEAGPCPPPEEDDDEDTSP
jgi:hypothetical protein